MGDTQHERLTLTVEETAEKLGISRGLAYEAVANGEIPVVRVGRRLLVPVVGLEKMLKSSQKEEPQSDETSRH